MYEYKQYDDTIKYYYMGIKLFNLFNDKLNNRVDNLYLKLISEISIKYIYPIYKMNIEINEYITHGVF